MSFLDVSLFDYLLFPIAFTSLTKFFLHSYEKSDTFRFEVPRMLLDDPNQLESYIMKTKDK